MTRILDRIEIQKCFGIFDLRVGVFIIGIVDFLYAAFLALGKTNWYYAWAIFTGLSAVSLLYGGYKSSKVYLVPWLIHVFAILWFSVFIFVWIIWHRLTTATSDDAFDFYSLLLFKIFSHLLHLYFFSVVYSFMMQLIRESREFSDTANVEAYI